MRNEEGKSILSNHVVKGSLKMQNNAKRAVNTGYALNTRMSSSLNSRDYEAEQIPFTVSRCKTFVTSRFCYQTLFLRVFSPSACISHCGLNFFVS